MARKQPALYFYVKYPLFHRYFFDQIDRSYIEIISKLYRSYIEEMHFLTILVPFALS
jgi:hypothetical protein